MLQAVDDIILIKGKYMKKKVLILGTCPLSNDGITKIEMDICRQFHNDLDLEFALGFSFDNKYGRELQSLGVRLHELEPKAHVLKYMKSIETLVRNNSYDTVYIHGNSAMMYVEARPSSRGGAGRVIAHCHNTSTKHPFFHKVFKPFFNRTLDLKIGCSAMAAEWAYGGRNILVIPNGIDTKRMAFDPAARSEKRLELGVEDKVLVGHIGRFIEQKNHDKVVSVFREFHQANENSHLLLIGSGKEKERIAEKVRDEGLSDDVTFIDYTDTPEAYISAMDVMLMPSLYEGFGLVAAEAQANGLPIVISDKFPVEAVIIPDGVTVKDLTDGDEEWSKALLEAVGRGRYVPDRNSLAKMDWQEMMNSIRKVLISD